MGLFRIPSEYANYEWFDHSEPQIEPEKNIPSVDTGKAKANAGSKPRSGRSRTPKSK